MHTLLEQDRAKLTAHPHTLKAGVFQLLEEAGPSGLQGHKIVELTGARGMKDWSCSSTPMNTISALCSHNSDLFIRIAPSTYALRAFFGSCDNNV